VKSTTARPFTTPVVAGSFATIATMLLMASAVTILWPETPLSRMWDLKPAEYRQLLGMGWPVAIGFLVVAVAAAFTAVGMFGRRRWAWWLAVAGLTVNGLSDAVRIVLGSPLEGAVGVLGAGLVLWWLLRPAVRAQFR
jgi:hypothetical protein